MIVGTVYLVTNVVNGKIYVGKTEACAIEERLRQHIAWAPYYDTHFAHALCKYGAKSFVVEPIVTANSSKKLNELEEYWILKTGSYKPEIGYNMTMGGDGVIPTEETRKKMSKSRCAIMTPEFRKKISESLCGKKRSPFSPETCRKMSEGQRGRVHPPETRRKISESLRGKALSLEHCRKISEGQCGKKRRPFSQEHRRKISEGQRGKTLSPEHCRKISEGHRGKTLSPEHVQAIRDGWARRRERLATLKENAA